MTEDSAQSFTSVTFDRGLEPLPPGAHPAPLQRPQAAEPAEPAKPTPTPPSTAQSAPQEPPQEAKKPPALPATDLSPALDPLIETPQWVVWKWTPKSDGPWTKVPHQGFAPLYRASTSKSATWCTYKCARDAHEGGFADGIGFCLQGTDIIAFDIDDCRDKETGALHPWARQLLERANSYAEVTPSGTGIRIIGHGSGPETQRKLPVHGGVSCELYRNTTRYITMSGQQIGTAERLAHLDALMDETLRDLDKAKSGTPEDGGHHDRQGSDALVDVEDLDIPSWAKDLATGEPGRRKYPSNSEAVFGLIGAMLKGGVPDAVQVAVLLDPAFVEGEHLRKERDPAASAQRQIDRYRARFPTAVAPVERDDEDEELQWYGETPPAPPNWLIKHVIPAGLAGSMPGQWGTYKTFVALDLAGSVITGRPFMDKYRVKRQGGVLFIAAESAGDLPIRLDALVYHRLKLDPQSDLVSGLRHDLPFAWLRKCPPLCEKGALEYLLSKAEKAAAKMAEDHGVPLALIIIDTMSAAAGFMDENNNAEVQKVQNLLGALAKQTGAAVLAIDHYGKDTTKGARGASAKEGSIEFQLAVLGEREENGKISNSRLAVRKVKSAPAGFEVPFTPRIVPLGKDEDGDPITSCIIEWGEQRAMSAGTKKDKKLGQAARDLQHVVDDLGGLPKPREEVREAFYDLRPAEQTKNAKRQAFDRALRDLGIKGEEILSRIETAI